MTEKKIYDDAEAKALLSMGAEEDSRIEGEAAIQMLVELCGLNELKLGGVHIAETVEDNGIWIRTPAGKVTISVTDDGKVVIYSVGGTTPVPVRYDPVKKMMVGTKPDKFHTPVPGQPIRMQSAFAAVVEAALNKLGVQSTWVL